MNEHPIERLLAIMRRLRDPDGGCPWDRRQSFASIAPYTLEEAYEVADAIERGAMEELRDELGDLLFQVVFHTQMAAEMGTFDFEAVVQAIIDKLVERHPHVFGDATLASAEEQSRAWEAHKARDRERRRPGAGSLDGVSLALPALTRAAKLQRRAARVGFDWPAPAPVLEKVEEELQELREAMGKDAVARREELGDLLFACVNLARHLGVDPEAALRSANAKFERRFRQVEAALAARGSRAEQASLAEMDALWEAAKSAEAPDSTPEPTPRRSP